YNSRILDALRGSVEFSSYSFANVMPSLSEYFVSKVFQIFAVSTVLVVVVVFIVFRSFVPSIAVLSGAFADIIIAMGAMGLFGIPLTLSSFAALLMLVGFSLDTDMLLTLRVIKRTEGTARERAYDAMKTGITMSSATILSFSVLFALALITHISTYYQIAAVAICGLFGDVIATWMFNAVIVLWYMEKKERKR
ncbi:MAG: protein translocase subunit SecF, partial [Candidatus Micrarchaeota archaeon]